MIDYKAFYECEVKRADKAEDALSDMMSQRDALKAEIDGMLENQSTLEWEVAELREVAQALRAELNAARDALELGNLWRDAALVVGEHLASVGPTGYYDFGPDRWREWALSAIEELRGRVAELEARLV